MAIPSYGAAPVARIFLIVRALQLVCFAGIIGITASFISEIVATNHTTPREILGTIAVVRFSPTSCPSETLIGVAGFPCVSILPAQHPSLLGAG